MTPPIVRSWLLSLQAEGASKNTVLAYRQAMSTLSASMGDTPLLDATRGDIRLWLSEMRQAGRKPATLRTRFVTARGFYAWAIAEGEATTNPTDGIQAPTIPDDLPLPTVTAEQVRALLAIPGTGFLSRRDSALLHVLLDGGLRREECIKLTLDDVDLDAGRLLVHGKGAKRAERVRIAQLGVRTGQALDRYLRVRVKHLYAHRPELWLSTRGVLTYNGIKDVVRKHGRRVGVELHPHMLRHTWASEFRRAGGSEGDLMILGGWRSRNMLDRYGRDVAEDRAREAYRRLSVTDRLR